MLWDIQVQARPALSFKLAHHESLNRAQDWRTLNKTLLPNSPKESATDLDSESLASDKYKSIKAFRTITTMLHHIPSQHEISVVDMPLAGHDPKKDKELKLLNALATLLVRSDEVAAVAVTRHDVGLGDI